MTHFMTELGTWGNNEQTDRATPECGLAADVSGDCYHGEEANNGQ